MSMLGLPSCTASRSANASTFFARGVKGGDPDPGPPTTPIVSATCSRTAESDAPRSVSRWAASPSWWRSPNKRCSVPMKPWPSRRASSWASTRTWRAESVKRSNTHQALHGSRLASTGPAGGWFRRHEAEMTFHDLLVRGSSVARRPTRSCNRLGAPFVLACEGPRTVRFDGQREGGNQGCHFRPSGESRLRSPSAAWQLSQLPAANRSRNRSRRRRPRSGRSSKHCQPW